MEEHPADGRLPLEVDVGGEVEVVVAFANHPQVLVDETNFGEVNGLVLGHVHLQLFGNKLPHPLFQQASLVQFLEHLECDEVTLDQEGLELGLFDV